MSGSSARWLEQLRALEARGELIERAAQQPRHVHLREPDAVGDVALREVLLEAQAQQLLVALAQARGQHRHRDGVLGLIERRIVPADVILERHDVAVDPADRAVERVGILRGRSEPRLQQPLHVRVELLRELGRGRYPPLAALERRGAVAALGHEVLQ